MRCHRPGSWQPACRIEGGEHIEAALAEGRGALLWVMPFRYSDLISKIALHRNGYDVSHLSRFNHPGSNTRLGCAFVNPVRTSIEGRHLGERLVIGRDVRIDGRATLEVLSDRLAANRLVTITVGTGGRRTLAVPFLDGEFRVATGPAHLALTTGAPILPAFTIAEAPGDFTVTIGAPLDAGAATDDAGRIEGLIRDFAGRLEPFAEQWPDQFPWVRFAD